jgi:hypothetical protein
MTIGTVMIDTGASLAAAADWEERADWVARRRATLSIDLDDLQLDGTPPAFDVVVALDGGALELAATALFLRLLVGHLEAADRFGGPLLDAVGIANLATFARAALLTPDDACSMSPYPLPPAIADLAGTNDAEPREPWVVDADSAAERGLDLVVRALVDTATDAQIRADEFQVVRLDDGRFVVVLPGVIDLSRPDLGLDDDHRSVRDVDQHAYPSSRSTSVADNRYAQMVSAALALHGVPVGSELVIVGHSFGADTALDLAADPSFNGPGGFRVSHVVAAAYHSGPQLPHVPSDTAVLVLQNHRDVAVIAEAVGEAHVVEAIEARRSVLGDVLALDPIGAIGHVGDAAFHDAMVVVSGVRHLVSRSDDVAAVAAGLTLRRPDWVLDGMGEIVTLESGVSTPRDGLVVAVFEGGGDGIGHAQSNYLDFLLTTTDPDVRAFLASLGAGPSAWPPDTGSPPLTGSAWAIDVSVP